MSEELVDLRIRLVAEVDRLRAEIADIDRELARARVKRWAECIRRDRRRAASNPTPPNERAERDQESA